MGALGGTNEGANAELFEELGVTGLQAQYGTVTEEWLRKLQGKNGVAVYREMSDNDPVVGSVLHLWEALIRATTWTVRSADPTNGEANRWRDFVESCQHDMEHTWDDMISEALTMLTFGWALHEPIYKRRNGRRPAEGKASSKYDDGLIGWRKIPLRAQETLEEWDFCRETGKLKGFCQRDPVTYRKHTIPRERFVLFRTRAIKDNPEGYSMLRRAYRAWYYKKRIESYEASGVERDMVGIPVAYLPPEYLSSAATPDQVAIRNAIQTNIQRMRRDERVGLVWPARKTKDGETGFDIELLSTGGKRQIETNAIIQRYDQRIAMTMMAQFLLLGMDGVGSFSLAASSTSILSFALGAVLGSMQETINNGLVAELMELNGVDPELWPTIEHGDVESVDLGEFAEMLNKLVGAGAITPDEALEEHIRSMANLPDREAADMPGDLADFAAPVVTPGAESASDRDAALNGIQVRSAKEIVQDVARGTLPKATAQIMLTAMLAVPEALAAAMLAPVVEGSLRDVLDAEVGKADSYKLPAAARNNARKVLRWREEHGDEVRGMTDVGWRRARQLADNETVGIETVKAMSAFNRHRKNAEVAAEYKDEPWRDAGYVAWLGWGGTTGIDWARGITGAAED